MAEKSYVVTAPCAVIYNTARTAAPTVKKGGAVPADSDPEHVKVLLGRGLIAEGEATGGLPVSESAPAFTPAAHKSAAKAE